MRKTTIKVAELATFFYALLVLLSLIIDTAYYSQFNIRIVSYMTIAEILLSCIERFDQFLPAILVVGGFFVGYMVFGVDPLFRTMLNPIKLFNKKRVDESFLKKLRQNVFFGTRRSINSKYSVVVNYSLFGVILPLAVVAVTLRPFYETVNNYSSAKLVLFLLLLVYGILVISYSLFFDSIREKQYDWSKYPHRSEMFSIDEIRKVAAPHRFSKTERTIVRGIYRYRLFLMFLIFFLSLFTALWLAMFFSAKSIKDNGSNQCVVVKCGDEIIDTRVQNLDYIGESSRCLFIYDRATHGTRIIEWRAIDTYLCFPRETFNNAKVTQINEYNYVSQIKDPILEQMRQSNELVVCDYYFDEPNLHYQLISHELNHYIWVDTINQTFLEQITLPQANYTTLPSDDEIFCLTI